MKLGYPIKVSMLSLGTKSLCLDLGLYCDAMLSQLHNYILIFSLVCSDGHLRLTGGTTEVEGHVEICLNNTYGTICDRNFDNLDAEVVCRVLQFSTESK